MTTQYRYSQKREERRHELMDKLTKLAVKVGLEKRLIYDTQMANENVTMRTNLICLISLTSLTNEYFTFDHIEEAYVDLKFIYDNGHHERIEESK